MKAAEKKIVNITSISSSNEIDMLCNIELKKFVAHEIVHFY